MIFPPNYTWMAFRVGSAEPPLPPLVTAFAWVTARWVPVPGLGWSVCSVKWAHLVSVMQDMIFCAFVLHLVFVFSLFNLWVPTNKDSPKLVELVRIKPYN